MKNLRAVRRLTVVAVITLGASLWTSCSEQSPESLTGPSTGADFRVASGPDLQAAIQAQNRQTDALLRTPGVIGTAVGRLANGKLGVRIFLEHAGVEGLPSAVDGIPVATEVTGRFMAFSDPTTEPIPAAPGKGACGAWAAAQGA